MSADYIEHRWINKNTIEKREYQERIAHNALKANTLVVLPTGLGKTPLAALVSAYRLEQDMHKKILFIAPTKPLVAQHRRSFERFLKIGPSELKIITGEIKPEKRKGLYEKSDIVFATPQTIRNDLKKGILNLKKFSLLIVDEAHRAVKNYAYTYIAKKYIQQAEKPLILGLTASPGGHLTKINEVKQALFIKQIETRTKDDRDVKHYVKGVEQHWIKVDLTDELKKIKKYLDDIKEEKINILKKWNIIHGKISKSYLLKVQEFLARKKYGSSFAAMSLIAEIIKIDHCLLLLETQCLYALKKYFNKIISDAETAKTKAVVRLAKNENFQRAIRALDEIMSKGKEHPKIERLVEIVENEYSKADAKIIIFAQYRDTVEKIYTSVKKIAGCKPVILIGQSGSAGLSQKEQVKKINEFDMGFYNCLICTSIGEEGLHMGTATTAIFYEPVPSAIRTVQRRGRVGREKVGRLYILITADTRDEAYFWSAYHKEKKMKKILDKMKEKTLKDLI
ncbi:MAG: hypothetical protein B6U68_01970 [Candidatus Aenigmarchaeota archaeon ex4484_14]|nr:MAG: hypothetical protein B6U68_01970 [Candidatus Aenigmarchaeota archaeon ex4484_14]RLJ04941.1 MAG: hypothetical protein DRP08_00505 [Candidatus Aenigmarchaeota archaeon]